MDSRIKRFFNKGKGNGKSSGNQGSANDTTHLDPRGNPVRSKAEEHINQSPTVSEKNQYVASFPVVYHDLPLVYSLWLT